MMRDDQQVFALARTRAEELLGKPARKTQTETEYRRGPNTSKNVADRALYWSCGCRMELALYGMGGSDGDADAIREFHPCAKHAALAPELHRLSELDDAAGDE